MHSNGTASRRSNEASSELGTGNPYSLPRGELPAKIAALRAPSRRPRPGSRQGAATTAGAQMQGILSQGHWKSRPRCRGERTRRCTARPSSTLLRLLLGALLVCQSTQASYWPQTGEGTGSRRQLHEPRRTLQQKPTRGILIVGHGLQLLSAYVNIEVMREDLHCKLPIEVVYFGAKEAPPAHIGDALKRLEDVQLIDGNTVAKQDLRPLTKAMNQTTEDKAPTGFHTKIYALIHVTSFDEVLYLDSDCLPLMYPEALFNAQEYKQHGNLFWPDLWHPLHSQSKHPHIAVRPDLYVSLGLQPFWNASTYRQYRAAESGQFLLDRVRHKDVLSALWAFAWEPEVKKHAWGDKEMYRLAFVYLNQSETFQQVEIPPRAGAGVSMTFPLDQSLYLQGLIQSSPIDARPAFLHRTGGSKLHYITAPMREEDANHLPFTWTWEPHQYDTKAWERRDCSYQHTPSKYRNTTRRDVPEQWCRKQEANKDRLPMYSIDLFHDAHKYMLAAHLYMRDFVYRTMAT